MVASKSVCVASMVALFLLLPGFHPHMVAIVSFPAFVIAQRFYVGRWQSGLVWLFTLGCFGIGWIVDVFLISDFCDEYNTAAFQRQFYEITSGDSQFNDDDTMGYGVVGGGNDLGGHDDFYYPNRGGKQGGYDGAYGYP